MSDEDDNVLVGTEDFESWYDGDLVGIEFLADGVTKEINKEDFRDFCKFISQTLMNLSEQKMKRIRII